MVLFFFYQKLTNIDLLKKINDNFEIYDGYIMVQSYDKENNVLQICDKNINNNTMLYGKIVKFDMNVKDIIYKINNINECKDKDKDKNYTLDTILVNRINGYGCYYSNIIY